MILSFHYCEQGLCNCYILGGDYEAAPESAGKNSPRDTLIVDPGCMNESMLNFIENNEYTLKGILLTHNHPKHINGLRSLKRIYDVDIYSANSMVMDYKSNVIRDGDTINIGSFTVKAVSAPGHSIDSMLYIVEHLLFTGDVLSAGLMGRTDSSYGAMRQIAMIQNKIFTLRGDYIVLPGHGPPSTLNVEREYNIGIGLFEENRNRTRHTSLSLDLLDSVTV
ncbi:MAG: MBL fold metallo-hydrolase [Spirochaetaceae bacterium]|jgi:glyoxylase-like metal-dependent hydrolase (beta-lactamase superfamily II)|nr:MBL fold metallo-hydrolase [Spirochaetaceae bacterium]